MRAGTSPQPLNLADRQELIEKKIVESNRCSQSFHSNVSQPAHLFARSTAPAYVHGARRAQREQPGLIDHQAALSDPVRDRLLHEGGKERPCGLQLRPPGVATE